MAEKDFTIINAYEQFWIALEDGERRSLTSAYLTYGYLCHVWNGCGRPVSFRRQNTKICADISISKPTLDRHRNILKLAGLINFYTKGKGDSNIYYEIKEVKKLYFPKEEKEKIFTSPVTSHVTSPDDIKQSIEKELVVVVNGEVKNFYYLKNLFEQDVGLKMNWEQKGFPGAKFSKGIEQWMIQNHNAKYENFEKIRRHFLYWMPNFCEEIKSNFKVTKTELNGTNNVKKGNFNGRNELSGTAIIQPDKKFAGSL